MLSTLAKDSSHYLPVKDTINKVSIIPEKIISSQKEKGCQNQEILTRLSNKNFCVETLPFSGQTIPTITHKQFIKENSNLHT